MWRACDFDAFTGPIAGHGSGNFYSCPVLYAHRCFRLLSGFEVHQGARFSRSATEPVGRPSEAPVSCGQSLLFYEPRAPRDASCYLQMLFAVPDPIPERGG